MYTVNAVTTANLGIFIGNTFSWLAKSTKIENTKNNTQRNFKKGSHS